MVEPIIWVDSELFIGGDVPESLFDAFVTKLSQVYSNPNNYRDIKLFKKIIENEIDTLDNAPLFIKLQLIDGEINQDFLFFCATHKIKVKNHLAPYVDKDGNYYNESFLLLTGGPSPIHSIPLNGEGKPTTVVEDVFTIIYDVLNVYEKPIEEAPLCINEAGIVGDISRRKLAGEPLRKILTEILEAKIDYPDTTIPPFKILKGK